MPNFPPNPARVFLKRMTKWFQPDTNLITTECRSSLQRSEKMFDLKTTCPLQKMTIGPKQLTSNFSSEPLSDQYLDQAYTNCSALAPGKNRLKSAWYRKSLPRKMPRLQYARKVGPWGGLNPT